MSEEAETEKNTELTDEMAAIKIQRAYRRFVDKSLFKKLKNLVHFRNQGDPGSLLKAINPIEAQLLDPAIGAHVRFRLGGYEWPPQIYYKIFLHSPVCDVNSYAPRNYMQKYNADIPPITQEQLNEYAEKYGWYHRVENNGWRPISSLSPSAIDIITQMTNKATSHKKYKPKRQKMKKEIAEMKVKRFLAEKKAENGDIDLDINLDDEGLFEWVEKLDMEKYREDWETLGTTGPSSNLWWAANNGDSDYSIEYSSSDELDIEKIKKLIE